MQTGIEGSFVVVKLDDGEDLFESIRQVIEERNIESGIVLTGIGMLRDFEVGYFDGDKYITESYEEAHELVALHGSLTEKGDIHLHCALAGRDHRIIGGHLVKGTVAVLNEITLLKFPSLRFSREINPKSGLKEFGIK